MSEKETPLSAASCKLHESLKGHFWIDGGFLQATGYAENTGTIHVYLARKLRANEKLLIPASVDGFEVKMKVVGKIGIGGKF